MISNVLQHESPTYSSRLGIFYFYDFILEGIKVIIVQLF